MTQLSSAGGTSIIAEFLGRRRNFLVLYALTAVGVDWLNQVNIFYAGFAPIHQLLQWFSGGWASVRDAPVIAFTLLGPLLMIVLARARGQRVNKPKLVVFPILSFGYTVAVPALVFGLGIFPVPLWWVFDALCLINGGADESSDATPMG
jgi:hypothetical protein